MQGQGPSRQGQRLDLQGQGLDSSGQSGFVKQGGSPDEARLEQTPYPFQPH